MSYDRRINDLKPGEAAYTVAHAAWIAGSDMMLNGSYPIRTRGGGTFELRLVKTPSGRLFVDLSGMSERRFHSVPAFGPDVRAVKVDELLEAPAAAPGAFRVFDLARARIESMLVPCPINHLIDEWVPPTYVELESSSEVGYIKPSDAWIWGPHMFLDGHTEMSREFTDEHCLRVERRADGAYVVDVSYVFEPRYSREPGPNGKFFPIQVVEAVRRNPLGRN